MEKPAPCTGSQSNLGCTAKKVYANEQRQICEVNHPCPPPPEKLKVTFYEQKLFTNRADTYYGANVSWVMQKTDQDDTADKSFEAGLLLTSGHMYIVKVKVNVTAMTYKDNKATVHYDCFFPLMANDTWVNVSVYSLPYRKGNDVSQHVITPLSPNYQEPTKELPQKRAIAPVLSSGSRPTVCCVTILCLIFYFTFGNCFEVR